MTKQTIGKQKLFIITGPTAIGKSSLSIEVAKQIDAEIISCDSMQVYRGLDIGTGKITKNEMHGVRHHLIDIVDPSEEYSVARFVEDSKKAIEDISRRGKKVVLCGGTGLYINALLNNYNFASAQKSIKTREVLSKRPTEELYQELLMVDDYSAKKISKNDRKRIIRALEIFYETSEKKSEIATKSSECKYDYRLIVLSKNRELIYGGIGKRVDQFFEDGLLDEVKRLIKFCDFQSMQAIGYKETVQHLNGLISFDELKEKIKQNSRRYAKRQLTYFRGMKTEKIWIEDNFLPVMRGIVSDFYEK
ncbi:MAG: tRNA (adenosine(37)-N6)-dimethylallyltransferase MiaA [Firmicutes bacterium]|nr:tRNA (adenosine(37)-N6)-dimethylallyltransferase MiaA [Bacillota bacterium]MCL2255782.1 tRNA (adenosine(37)-N6)-dimethylallyltransferase MiaA [Bacillota bacterium]